MVLLHGNGSLVAVPQPLWAFRISDTQESVKTEIRTQAGQVIYFFRELPLSTPDCSTDGACSSAAPEPE